MTTAEELEPTVDEQYIDYALTELARAAASMDAPPYARPEEKAPTRLARAYELCKSGRVSVDTQGVFNIPGSTYPQRYLVDPQGCSCPASQKSRSKWCYHLVAAALWDRWQSRITPGYKSLFIKGAIPVPRVDRDIEEAEMAEEAALLDWPPEESLLDAPAAPVAVQEPVQATQPTLAAERQVSPLAQLPGASQTATTPLSPYRPLAEIIADLSKPLSKECVATRQQQGQTLSYLHWWDVRLLLDTYAPGWHGEIVEVQESDREVPDRQGTVSTLHTCTVRYRLTIPCAEGQVSREALGREEAAIVQYGDHTSNASAMAMTRAAAMFGVGVWLREKDGTSTALQRHLLTEALQSFGAQCEARGQDKQQALAQLMQAQGVTRRDALPLWAVRQMIE